MDRRTHRELIRQPLCNLVRLIFRIRADHEVLPAAQNREPPAGQQRPALGFELLGESDSVLMRVQLDSHFPERRAHLLGLGDLVLLEALVLGTPFCVRRG
jgi:hypothetical protein